MMRSLALVVALVAMSALAAPQEPDIQQVFHDYIFPAEDPLFKWEVIPGTEISGETGLGCKWTGLTLNVTSGAFLTPAMSDRPIWWHYLNVIFPSNRNPTLDSKIAMYITGGHNTGGPPSAKEGSDLLVTTQLACGAGMVAATLYDVPAQPITFANDPNHKPNRIEDDLVGFTWYLYQEQGGVDPTVLAYWPMARAGVRAFDALQEYLAKYHNQKVETYVVAGASKRGATTWLVSAADSRVDAAVPIVFDLLNMHANLHHFWRAYGGWTFALEPYYSLNLTLRLDEPVTQKMFSVMDPMVLGKNSLTMPKMMIRTTGDEFFMNDDTYYYTSDDGTGSKFNLPGQTLMQSMPNCEHSCAECEWDVVQSVTAFLLTAIDPANSPPRPSFSWSLANETGIITASMDQGSIKPTKALVWHSTTIQSDRRDWRLIGGYPTPGLEPVFWESFEIHADENGIFTAAMPLPTKDPNGRGGPWTAFEIQFIFPGAKGLNGYNYEQRYTTAVSIIPQVFPYAPCVGAGCQGHLL